MGCIHCHLPHNVFAKPRLLSRFRPCSLELGDQSIHYLHKICDCVHHCCLGALKCIMVECDVRWDTISRFPFVTCTQSSPSCAYKYEVTMYDCTLDAKPSL